MKFDPRRVFLALSAAGALVVATPVAGYAQGAKLATPTSPISIQQEASDDDNVAADDQTAFIRTAISDGATEIEAARLAQQRSADPAVRQFASVQARQYQEIVQDASGVAARHGVNASQAPTDGDETALIAALRNASGQEFDETYLRAFVQDQRVTLKEYMAARDSMDGEVSKFADRHIGKLSDQLRAAVELARRLDVEIEES